MVSGGEVMARAIQKASNEELRQDKVPGSYYPVIRADGSVAGFKFLCPCGCGNESWLHFKCDDGLGGWTMTGDIDSPTLTPSVFQTGMPCKWHGWLRGGEWVSV